jgi:hypothetical protein
VGVAVFAGAGEDACPVRPQILVGVAEKVRRLEANAFGEGEIGDAIEHLNAGAGIGRLRSMVDTEADDVADAEIIVC